MRNHGKTAFHSTALSWKGRWDAIELEDHHRLAVFTCPVCFRSLSCMDSEVKNGQVVPSAACSPDCPVHQGVTLRGWS